MIVVAYTRVSTDGQLGDDKFGLDAQKEQIQRYCADHEMTIARWYTDEGESGAKERPGFDEIVYSEVANPPYEAVVVAKSDRVARDINIYYYYKMMLKKKGMALVSIAEDFGQFGVFAPMLEAFTLCCADMERQNIMKRTAGGRRIKADRGGYSGGSTPYGYKNVGGVMVIDPEQAEVVREIFRLRSGGWGFKLIADELNKDGKRNRSGGVFYASTVKCIVDNERTYRGEYKYGKNGEWVKGQQEAILK